MKHTAAGSLRGALAGMAGVVSIVAVVSGMGLAAANASPARPAHAARPASAAKSGTEQFYLMSTLPDASRYQMIVTGLFTAAGTDIVGTNGDTAQLPGGSFKIHHGTLHIIKQSLNKKTCVGMFEATASFSVSGGTGKYKGISGSGKATFSSVFLTPKTSKGACNLNTVPAANQQTITGTANVKL